MGPSAAAAAARLPGCPPGPVRMPVFVFRTFSGSLVPRSEPPLPI